MYLIRSVCVFVLVLLPLHPLLSQSDSAQVYRLVLPDGISVRGTIVVQTSDSLTFKTLSGVTIRVAQSGVVRLEAIEGDTASGPFFMEDPNRTRLFFSPTARTLPKGKGYFSVYELFFPMIAYGPTDWMTLSGGFSLLPGASSQLLYFAPKVRAVHADRFDASLGILYIRVPEETKGLGIAYGVMTGGASRASFTFGLGWGYYGDDFSDSPLIVLGGELQVSESTKLLSENWIPPGGEGALLFFGIRFFGEHLAGDFGLMTTTEASGDWPFMPWVGIVYNF